MSSPTTDIKNDICKFCHETIISFICFLPTNLYQKINIYFNKYLMLTEFK